MWTAWERLDEIAGALPAQRWMRVGGLMVHAHAQLAGVPHARPTDDADLVVEVRVGSYTEAAVGLGRLGYERRESLDHRAPFHRFTRSDGQVDLMGPEGTPLRFAGRPVLAVPGSRSALNRTLTYQTPGGVEIRVPDVDSALSMKGAAHQTTSANRIRHVQDAVTLSPAPTGRPLPNHPLDRRRPTRLEPARFRPSTKTTTIVIRRTRPLEGPGRQSPTPPMSGSRCCARCSRPRWPRWRAVRTRSG